MIRESVRSVAPGPFRAGEARAKRDVRHAPVQRVGCRRRRVLEAGVAGHVIHPRERVGRLRGGPRELPGRNWPLAVRPRTTLRRDRGGERCVRVLPHPRFGNTLSRVRFVPPVLKLRAQHDARSLSLPAGSTTAAASSAAETTAAAKTAPAASSPATAALLHRSRQVLRQPQAQGDPRNERRQWWA